MTLKAPPQDLITQTSSLFLDFDGTLAPIGPDPDVIFLNDGLAQTLHNLAGKLDGALALISGRDIYDLSARVPETVWRFGNHGLYALAPGETELTDGAKTKAPHALQAIVADIIAPYEGAWLEVKGPVIAVHVRQALEHSDQISQALSHGVQQLENDYLLQSGKAVFELKPQAANKGKCLDKYQNHAPFKARTPIMFGDDTTDEDAFKAAQSHGGAAVKVGAGETCANYRLPDPGTVAEFLRMCL